MPAGSDFRLYRVFECRPVSMSSERIYDIVSDRAQIKRSYKDVKEKMEENWNYVLIYFYIFSLLKQLFSRLDKALICWHSNPYHNVSRLVISDFSIHCSTSQAMKHAWNLQFLVKNQCMKIHVYSLSRPPGFNSGIVVGSLLFPLFLLCFVKKAYCSIKGLAETL